MEIKIKIDDLTLFATALNNAIVAYEDIVWGIYIGCEVPDKFNKLKKLEEDLMARVQCLKNVYKQIEELEKETSYEKTYI